MESILGIFPNIANLNANHLFIYLQGYKELQSFADYQTSGKNVIQTINSLLIKASSRRLGLQLLNEYMKQCSSEVFEAQAQLWTTWTLKALNAADLQSHAVEVFNVLAQIAQRAKNSNEFAKTFAHSHLNKIYESLTLVHTTDMNDALKCIQICLRSFPGPSGAAKATLAQVLLRYIDTIDEELSQNCAKCQHLILQVRGGGNQKTSHSSQWQIYQKKLMGNIHMIFNDMFAKCYEITDMSEETEIFELPELNLSDEPAQRQAQLYIRLHNLINHFIYTLSEPFPAAKPIMPKRILNLISRGLSVNSNVIKQNAISDNLALAILLPKIHLDLLELLRVLLLSLGSHMKIFHTTILSLLDEVLMCTSSAPSYQKPYANIRTKTYELLGLWCSIMQSGSCCDIIAEHLIKEIMLDIMPVQNEFVLKVQNDSQKHMSKKSSKQAHKVQNLLSNIGQTHSPGAIKKPGVVPDMSRSLLCAAALNCLQKVLLTSGSLLKTTTVNFIQKSVLQVADTFFDLPLSKDDLFANWICRLEMYNVLYVIQLTPHPFCPPPTDLIFDILTKAYQMEQIQKIHQLCGELLLQLEKILHPQKEGLLFPLELHHLRSVFAARNNELHMIEENGCEQLAVSRTKDLFENEKEVEDLNGTNEDCAVTETSEEKQEYIEQAQAKKDEILVSNGHKHENVEYESEDRLNEENDSTDSEKESESISQIQNKSENLENSELELAPPNAKRAREEKECTTTKNMDDNSIANNTSLKLKDIDDEMLLADLEAAFVDEFI